MCGPAEVLPTRQRKQQVVVRGGANIDDLSFVSTPLVPRGELPADICVVVIRGIVADDKLKIFEILRQD